MSTTHHMPLFNLKAVVQETGLKPDTLRAWERRYGLPEPQRSDGGHRLYSQRDIDIIKWLMARQEEGLSIKRAVKMWCRLEATGQDPLRTTSSVESQVAIIPAQRTAGDAIAKLREDWLAACLAFDERGAEQALTQAFALYPPEIVCLELLQKGVAQVGQGWYESQVTVQQEHFTTALAMRRLEALVLASPPPTRPERILVACPPEDEHAFALLLITFLLRRRGWEVVYLGANVPTERLEATVTATRPQLVILGAQRLHTAASLLEVAQLLQRERVPLAFGGLIFNLLPALRDRIPGFFLGETVEGVPQVVEQLLASPRLRSSVEPTSEVHQQALAHYRERQTLIEANVWQAMAAAVAPERLTMANAELAHDIIAALKLGDMDFMGTGIRWMKGLLRNHEMPAELLRGYMMAYYQAAKLHLDERGGPILDWLAEFVEEND